MAALAVGTSRTPVSRSATGRRIAIVIGWHVLLALVAGAVLANTLNPDGFALSAFQRTALTLGAAVVALGQLLIAWLLRRRAHRGRAASLVSNYLLTVALTIAVLSRMQVFTGLDEFATAFQRGFWPLVVVGVGFVWWVLARRMHGAGRAATYLERAGLAVAAVATIAWLFVINIVGGLLTLAGRLAQPATIALLMIAVVSAAMAWAMWQDDCAVEFGTTRRQAEALQGWLYLSPNVLGFSIFFAGPLLFSFFISFFNWDALGDKSFTGLSNYLNLLKLDIARDGTRLSSGYEQVFALPFVHGVIGAKDKLFWLSMKNIIVFMVLAVPLSVVPALGLATLLNTGRRGMKVFRAVFFIPSIAGVIGITLIWKQLFNATVGFLNFFLTKMLDVVGALPFVHFSGAVRIQWLSSPSTALLAVVIVFAWMTFGFNTVLFTAGLQGVPKELYEAAELDGATAWDRFRNVTLPTLRPTTFFVLATTTILALQLFDIVYALTAPSPAGSPDNATLTPVVYLYRRGFERFDQGYASAVAWVLFVVIFTVTLVQFRRQQRQTEGV
ncbi:MAG: sugar ABC transporter permease [Mycobacteriales bacterium]